MGLAGQRAISLHLLRHNRASNGLPLFMDSSFFLAGTWNAICIPTHSNVWAFGLTNSGFIWWRVRH